MVPSDAVVAEADQFNPTVGTDAYLTVTTQFTTESFCSCKHHSTIHFDRGSNEQPDMSNHGSIRWRRRPHGDANQQLISSKPGRLLDHSSRCVRWHSSINSRSREHTARRGFAHKTCASHTGHSCRRPGCVQHFPRSSSADSFSCYFTRLNSNGALCSMCLAKRAL